jgi:hypothetical protein
MLIYDDRSLNVYENSRNTGIMTDEKSDINGNSTCILQKFVDFDGQFCRNTAFAACFLRKFAATGGTLIKISACSLPCSQNGLPNNPSSSRMTLGNPFMSRSPRTVLYFLPAEMHIS